MDHRERNTRGMYSNQDTLRMGIARVKHEVEAK